MSRHTEEDLSEIVASDKVEINSSSSLCMVSAAFLISSTLLKTETPVLIYRQLFHIMNNNSYATYLEISKSFIQSCLAFLEQCVHFTLTEDVLDLIPFLLCFNKCINLVEGSMTK
jgi:hypothetical protein